MIVSGLVLERNSQLNNVTDNYEHATMINDIIRIDAIANNFKD